MDICKICVVGIIVLLLICMTMLLWMAYSCNFNYLRANETELNELTRVIKITDPEGARLLVDLYNAVKEGRENNVLIQTRLQLLKSHMVKTYC